MKYTTLALILILFILFDILVTWFNFLVQSRYSAILERQGADLTSGTELVEPLEWWLQATTDGADKPKTNQIIGYPGVSASTLLPNLAHRFRERSTGGASSSSAVPNRPQLSRIHYFFRLFVMLLLLHKLNRVSFSDNLITWN